MPDARLTPEDVSAKVQQLLLSQGARYASRATEENWKRAAVALDVPEHPRLPAGLWVVLPWLAPSAAQVDAWLVHVLAGPLPPRVVVLAMDVPTVRPAMLRELAAQHRVDLVGISALDEQCYGTPLAAVLQVVFSPSAEEALAQTNPLEHLAALGDPRKPDVFFERLRRAAPRTPVTPWLVRLNIGLFVVSLALALHHGVGPLEALLQGFDNQTLEQLGANSFARTVDDGQWWRLLTCTLLHGNLLHIAMNLYALRTMADLTERLFGARAFLGVYLASALGGSVVSLGWTLRTSAHFSVGASGAIFGVMGGMLGFALARRNSVPAAVYRSLLRTAAMFSVINLAFGFSMRVVDNGAHIGGLLTGIVAGWLLSRELPPAPQPTPAQRLRAFAVLLALLAGGVALVARTPG